MKKVFLLTLVLSLLVNLAYTQDIKQKNFTPLQVQNTTKSITTPNTDNILTFLVQDFEGTTFPPAGWTNTGTAMWSRSTDASGYGVGSASALADFYSISSGGQLNLITSTFTPSVSGDSLRFDHAYATYQTEVDQLQIYTSTDGGTTWTLLITLLGGVNGPLVTAPPTTSTFIPTASQWATKRYNIPVGTNKVKFTGVSAYGNELYIDNILIGTPYSNDVSVAGIDVPKASISPGTVAPKVTVKNWGLTTQTFPVTITINPGGYTSTQNVTSLAPGATQQVTFPNWTAAVGSYNVVAYTQLSTDMNKSNDTSKVFTIASNINRGVLLEYCTGTWCVWCPCGASTAHTLETTYPSLVVLAYHGGGGGDPWLVYNGSGIINALSFGGYPTGIADRQNAAGDYTTFTGFVNNRYNNVPTTPISINILNQNYNPTTGLLSVTTNLTSVCNLPETYSVSYVIMENNLVYNQAGNGTCPGSGTFVHNHVVRSMVNNQNGDVINTGQWNANQTISKSFSTTIPNTWIAANCQLVIFVYKGTTANNSAEVQNAIKTGVTTTGINSNTEVPKKFELSQNYPNPFNPVTNIKFALPKSGNTNLKIYDIMGREVMTMFNGFMEAGYYNADLDASVLSSGMYFYKLVSGDFSEVRKMTLIK